MKLNKFKIFLLLVVSIVGISSIISYNSQKYSSSVNINDSKVKDNNMLSMMLETSAGSGEYKETTATSWPTDGYEFNETLSKCERGSKLSYDEDKNQVIFDGNTKDDCYVYFDVYVAPTFANYIKSKYKGVQGKNNLYLHDSTLTNGAGDNSYRYAGASESVNNYICLGSKETACPDANLFRIIGVFGDKTKVIRAKSVGDKQWHTSDDNTWSSSSLNTYLNGTYLTSLGTLADKIATTTWKVGGGSSTYLYDVPKTAYQNEVGSSASTTTYDAKIGLMYVSDYGFAADQSGWTTKLSSYNSNTSKNWLYLGSTEWTLSRISDYSYSAFDMTNTGIVNGARVTSGRAVRPSFNLLSSTTYVSGSGSMSDPVRIN